MLNLFNDLDGFLGELEDSLENSEKRLDAAILFLPGKADPNGNLQQTIQSIQNSKKDLAYLRENLPYQIDMAEDTDIAIAIKQYLNGEL